jgi:hypothetical protein
VGGKGRTLFLSRRRAAVIFVVVGTVRSAPSRNARRTASARTSVLFRDGQNIRVENPPCAASAASETATTSCGATSALVNASRDRRVGVGHVTRKPGLVSVPKEVSTPAEVSQIVDASWGGILSTVTSFSFFVTPSPSFNFVWAFREAERGKWEMGNTYLASSHPASRSSESCETVALMAIICGEGPRS